MESLRRLRAITSMRLIQSSVNNSLFKSKRNVSTSTVSAIKASELTKENLPPKEPGACPICSRGITFGMTDVLFLSQFMTPEGYMINRRKTGVCRKQQKKIFKFIHIARRIGLLPRKPPQDGGPPPEYGQKSKSLTKRTYKSQL